MAHQAAEKLYILGDIANGLLARVYDILEFQKPGVLSDPMMDPYLKKLEKGFPNLENAAKANQVSELFGNRSMEIVTGLTDYYNTFKDILNFKEEAWTLLNALATDLKPLDFKTAPDLTAYFLDLFVRYAQLHMLVSRVADRRLLLAAYAKAYQNTTGNTETKFAKIASFVEDYAVPQKQLREECGPGPLAKKLSDLLGSLTLHVMPWGQLSGFTSKKVFNVLEEAKGLDLPQDNDPLAILYLHRMQDWIVWGFFTCPAAITNENAVNLLCDVLKDHYVMPVFRDQVIAVHEEFVPIFDKNIVWGKKKEKGAFKISKCKKQLKAAADNYEGMRKAHEDMRVYVKHEAEILVELFNEFPALLAPRIQLVFAIAHMLVHELEWYFRHVHTYKDSSYNMAKKGVPPMSDSMIAAMFALVYHFHDLVLRHKKLIQKYYQEFISGLDILEARPVLESFQKNGRGSNLVNELLTLILTGCEKSTIEGSYHHIRLNWYRVSATVFSLAANCHDGESAKLSLVFGKITLHTRHIDCLDSQLNLACGLRLLYWYREDVATFLNSVIDGNMYGQGRYLLAIVRSLDSTLWNVHRLCPEEQKVIGKTSYELANTWIRRIVVGAENLLKAIVKERGALRDQTSESEVIHRMQLDSSQVILPGRESHWPHSAMVERSNIAKQNLADIISSIFSTDVINVYNVQFVPREYLYESMQLNIRSSLRNLVKARGSNHIQRPSVILTRLRDMMHAYQNVETHLNVNMSDIFRDVLLSEFSDDSIQGAGGGLEIDEKDPTVKRLETGVPTDAPAIPVDKQQVPVLSIQVIASWYEKWFASDIGASSTCFSPTVQAFITPPGSTAEVDAELYTNPVELQALCTLIGPYGVRVIDKALLSVVSAQVGEIKKIIQANSTQFTQLEASFTERPTWIAVRDSAQKMDELVTASSILGTILRFRHLLRRAQSVVVEKQVPCLYEVVKNSYIKVHNFKKGDPDFAPLDNLASDFGLLSVEADHALKTTLQKHKTQMSDTAIWTLIPEAYGMAMTSRRWREAKYNVVVAGHNNNVHCVADAIRALICTFNRLTLPSEAQLDPDVRIQTQYERFLLCASYSTLHMKALHEKKDGGSELAHVMVFLEQFITGSEGRLTLSMLERCYPYTILRTNYIQLYEKQTKTPYSGGGAGEQEDDEEKKTTKPEAEPDKKDPEKKPAPEKKEPEKKDAAPKLPDKREEQSFRGK